MSGWLAAQRGAVAAVLLLLAVAVQGATEALPKTGDPHGQKRFCSMVLKTKANKQ
jgi:cytochrome c oxidase assembly factor CtaG